MKLPPLPAWLRLARRETADGDLLCIGVSELGWRTTLTSADEQPVTTDAGRSPTENATPFEVLRRAVRSITPAQRERIGRVRILADDPAIALLDNRSLRIKSDDPVAIRQAGAQELGVSGATYAFLPFGASSEHEVPRGIYAFLSTGRMQDYLGALDSLAVKLVEFVPAGLLRLTAETKAPLAQIDVRATTCTLLLADPHTGLACCRELPLGVHRLAAAIVEATSVSITDASAGLERRACFAPDAASETAPPPTTATEKALLPILTAVREQLLLSIEYFTFQRLAAAPERLLVTGEVDRIRGLAAWLGSTLDLAPESEPDLYASFIAQAAWPGANLLATVPKGLLKIGKSEYRFSGDRFVTEDRLKPTTPSKVVTPGPPWVEMLKNRLEPLAVPICAGAILLAGTATAALTASTQSALLEDANVTLAAALVEDGIVRSVLAKRSASTSADTVALYWTEKLQAVSAAMPDGLNLRRFVSSADTPSAARDAKLTLEGETTSGESSIRQVDDLIRRLKANPRFMRDVAAINFDGSNSDRGGRDDTTTSASMQFVITVVLRVPGSQSL